MKQLCNRKVRDFAMALRARKVSGAFKKRAPVILRLNLWLTGNHSLVRDAVTYQFYNLGYI